MKPEIKIAIQLARGYKAYERITGKKTIILYRDFCIAFKALGLEDRKIVNSFL